MAQLATTPLPSDVEYIMAMIFHLLRMLSAIQILGNILSHTAWTSVLNEEYFPKCKLGKLGEPTGGGRGGGGWGLTLIISVGEGDWS